MRFSCVASILLFLCGSSFIAYAADDPLFTKPLLALGHETCVMVPYEYTTATTTVKGVQQTLLFTFTNLPGPATTPVKFTVSLRGDLDADDEWYYVEGEYQLVGYAGRFPNFNQCDADFLHEDMEMSANIFNILTTDNALEMRLRPNQAFIDPSECTSTTSEAFIKISYEHCDQLSLSPSEEETLIPSAQPSSSPPSTSTMPTSCTMSNYDVVSPVVQALDVK